MDWANNIGGVYYRPLLINGWRYTASVITMMHLKKIPFRILENVEQYQLDDKQHFYPAFFREDDKKLV